MPTNWTLSIHFKALPYLRIFLQMGCSGWIWEAPLRGIRWPLFTYLSCDNEFPNESHLIFNVNKCQSSENTNLFLYSFESWDYLWIPLAPKYDYLPFTPDSLKNCVTNVDPLEVVHGVPFSHQALLHHRNWIHKQINYQSTHWSP